MMVMNFPLCDISDKRFSILVGVVLCIKWRQGNSAHAEDSRRSVLWPIQSSIMKSATEYLYILDTQQQILLIILSFQHMIVVCKMLWIPHHFIKARVKLSKVLELLPTPKISDTLVSIISRLNTF